MRYPIFGSGDPSSVVKIYEAGTLDVATIYDAISGGSPIPTGNVTADANGRFVFFVEDVDYPFVSFFDVYFYSSGNKVTGVWSFFIDAPMVASAPPALPSLTNATVLDVCNLALMSLGEDPITDIEGTDTRSRACKRMYQFSRDAIFDLHNWSCLIERAKLIPYIHPIGTTGVSPPSSADGFAGAPQGVGIPSGAPPYEHAFFLPEKCLRILEKSYETEFPFLEESGILFSGDDGDVYIRFIEVKEDPAEWSPALLECVVLRLAANIAIPVTGQADLRKQMESSFVEALIRHGIQNYRGQGGATKLDSPGDVLANR